MASGQDIASDIPFLRRFARALAGSQPDGDALVLKALGAIQADSARFRAGPNTRVALYRSLFEVWDVEAAAGEAAVSRMTPDERRAREHLDALRPRSRVAFLLTALEGFSLPDIAAIMNAPRDEVENLIAEAGRDIAGQLRTDVLIIEDEPLIALDLRHLVEELGHRVTKIARTHREAVAAVGADRPGLILADIQLADGSSGLEAVDQILRDLEAPVIFVTAFPERFLTGAPPEPAFLISKPFDVESLKAVISQALFFDRRARRPEGGVNDAGV